MSRIAFMTIYNNSMNNIQQNQINLNNIQNQVSTGKKITRPSDDPAGTARSSALRSQLNRYDQYLKNITEAKSFLNNSETAISEVKDILHRIRELAVQGANDSLNGSDRKLIAVEVNQLLEEVYRISNSKIADKFLFGGDETLTDSHNIEPFSAKRNSAGDIYSVEYNGDMNPYEIQITEGTILQANIEGNRVFQTDEYAVESNITTIADKDSNLANYMSVANGYFKIDGQIVYYDTFDDSLQDIADRINNLNMDYEAEINGDSVNGYSLKIKSKNPHKILLEDVPRDPSASGTEGFLSMLGITNQNKIEDDNFKDRLAENADTTDKSLFKIIIDFRDHLNSNDRDSIETDIANLDKGITGLLDNLAEIGGKTNRLDKTEKRFENLKINITEMISNIEDTDFAEAITNLNKFQTIQQAALAATSKILNLSLANYL